MLQVPAAAPAMLAVASLSLFGNVNALFRNRYRFNALQRNAASDYPNSSATDSQEQGFESRRDFRACEPLRSVHLSGYARKEHRNLLLSVLMPHGEAGEMRRIEGAKRVITMRLDPAVWRFQSRTQPSQLGDEHPEVRQKISQFLTSLESLMLQLASVVVQANARAASSKAPSSGDVGGRSASAKDRQKRQRGVGVGWQLALPVLPLRHHAALARQMVMRGSAVAVGCGERARAVWLPGGLSQLWRRVWANESLTQALTAPLEQPPRAYTPAQYGLSSSRETELLLDASSPGAWESQLLTALASEGASLLTVSASGRFLAHAAPAMGSSSVHQGRAAAAATTPQDTLGVRVASRRMEGGRALGAARGSRERYREH